VVILSWSIRPIFTILEPCRWVGNPGILQNPADLFYADMGIRASPNLFDCCIVIADTSI
jgi:hypothetical protein